MQVLNDEMFAILVLMALFTTFITTPTVMAIYKPARAISPRSTGSKDGFPFFNRSHDRQWHDRLAGAFQAYSQCGRVSVRPSTANSSLSTMHEDICYVAEQKRVTTIILPFHNQWRMEMEREEMGGGRHEVLDSVGYGWRGVNQRVLKNSPCSVAVLVDRGYGNGSAGTTPNVTQRVCILFLGGPDDREAMELVGRMTEHAAVKVTIVRFVDRNGLARDGIVLRPSPEKCSEKNDSFSAAMLNREKEQGLDESAVEESGRKWKTSIYNEKAASNIGEEVLSIGRSGEYDLIVVGKGRFPSSTVAGLSERRAEHAELGPIEDILASSGQGVVSSVVVIEQHDVELADETTLCRVNSTSNDNNC